MKKLVLVVAVVVVGAFGARVQPAAALPPGEVSLYQCILNNGGSATVQSGVPVSVQTGWAATQKILVYAFLLDKHITLSVNGTAVPRPGSYFGAPVQSGNLWVSWLEYPTGIVLAAGQTMTVTFSESIFLPLWDGNAWTPSGKVLAGTCTITGV